MMQITSQPIVLIIGTRPEGIKMIPVYYALKRRGLPVIICSTMQHDELLTEVFNLFNIIPEYKLGIMRIGQDLFYLTQSVLHKTKEVFATLKPSLVLVQGDTTSTFAASLAAFYQHIPVGHIEAGLRTDDVYSPFPEEMNRRMVSHLATYHFPPTPQAAAHLLLQGIPSSRVFCVGNTVVDALNLVLHKIEHGEVAIRDDVLRAVKEAQQHNKKLMILTVHRRESFQGGIHRVLSACKQFLLKNPDVTCIYPFHPNPSVVKAINETEFDRLEQVYICDPLIYKDMVYILQACDGVVTDSGGVQEEAVSLGKQVIVVREKTERVEGVWAGYAHVVGTQEDEIIARLTDVMRALPSTLGSNAIYGDGHAADKIACILSSFVRECSVKDEQRTDSLQPVLQACVFEEKGLKDVKKVCVVGLGYIGLPTALVLAEHGFDVVGVDIDAERVARLAQGDPVIQEPDAFEKLQTVLQTGHLKVTTCMESADYFIIAVPTPFLSDKKADMSYVWAATQAIAPYIQQNSVVILESTVPVGSTELLAYHLESYTGKKAGIDFFVAHCPERVLPGKIFYELINNTRIIGGINERSAQCARDLYAAFVRATLYITTASMAEMVKLVENSSRDVQIAFANQVASMAYQANLDPYQVIELANKHPRVQILNPGCGVGGHCIAVDPWFLVESFPAQTVLLKAAREVNDAKPLEVIKCIEEEARLFKEQQGRICRVLLLGLTYKADVDDMRESPALYIAQTLKERLDMQIKVCEPHVTKTTLEVLLGSNIVGLYEGLETADVVVYLVGHKRFKVIDQRLLANKKLLDFCGILHTPAASTAESGEVVIGWPLPTMHTKEKDFLMKPVASTLLTQESST